MAFDSVTAYTLDEPFEVDPVDPYEKTNRLVYAFNAELDKWVLRPAAVLYDDAAPEPVESCVRNFFDNLKEPMRAISHALLLDKHAAVNSYSRFFTNTMVGGLGCFDTAESMGMERNEVDLGLVARKYEVVDGASPYLILPVLGPSTVVDGTGFFVSSQYVNPTHARNYVGRRPKDRRFYNPYVTGSDDALRNRLYPSVLQQRADLVDTTDILEAAALDPYSFLRDSYLDLRQAKAADLGNP